MSRVAVRPRPTPVSVPAAAALCASDALQHEYRNDSTDGTAPHEHRTVVQESEQKIRERVVRRELEEPRRATASVQPGRMAVRKPRALEQRPGWQPPYVTAPEREISGALLLAREGIRKVRSGPGQNGPRRQRRWKSRRSAKKKTATTRERNRVERYPRCSRDRQKKHRHAADSDSCDDEVHVSDTWPEMS